MPSAFDFPEKPFAVFLANFAWPDGLCVDLSMTGTKQTVLQTPAPPAKVGWSTETGVMTMNTMKTLAFATVAALSLGVGAAMAQEGGPSMPTTADFGVPKLLTVDKAAGANQVQFGSSDISAPRGQVQHYDYGTLANPG
jgi:hypothetical protein